MVLPCHSTEIFGHSAEAAERISTSICGYEGCILALYACNTRIPREGLIQLHHLLAHGRCLVVTRLVAACAALMMIPPLVRITGLGVFIYRPGKDLPRRTVPAPIRG